MSGLPDYLKELETRHEALRRLILQLGSALSRLDQVDRLEEITRQLQGPQRGLVVDWEATFPLRLARAWVVVGPGGITDDAEVVGETMSLFSRDLCQPDLEEYREQGKVVIAGPQFLELVAWLREEVMAGRLTLPYRPRCGLGMAIPVQEPHGPVARPEPSPGKE